MQKCLQTKVFTEYKIPYTGKELSPHWNYKNFNILGDSIVSFVGPADVPLSNMIDLVDVKNHAPIGSSEMLHFMGEWFIDSLDTGILLQHLFVFQAYETLLEKGIPGLSRRGNDLFYHQRKLSVSIATKTPVSVLMHFGINIHTEGTPVPTAGLAELHIEPFVFACEVLEKMERDSDVWKTARLKVQPR
jgi:hypothetical protein